MKPLLLGGGAEAALARAARMPLDAHVTAGPRNGDRFIDERRVVAAEPPGPPLPEGPFRRVADAIMAYRIFPEWLVRGVTARVPLRAGETFANRLRVLPGVEVFFAGRVKAVIAEDNRVGFTLQTVNGHPATGEETFEVCKDVGTGEVSVRISSWSRMAEWWMEPGEPIFRIVQAWAVRAALDNLGAVAGCK